MNRTQKNDLVRHIRYSGRAVYQPCILGAHGAIFEGQLLIGYPRVLCVHIWDTFEHRGLEGMVASILYALAHTAILS